MRYLTALVVALVATAASADDFAFQINKTRILDLVPLVCPALREDLGNPPQWSNNICMRNLAIRGLKRHRLVFEERAADADRRDRVRAARDAGEPTPTPEP